MRKMEGFCPKGRGVGLKRTVIQKPRWGGRVDGGDLHGPVPKVERSCGGGKNRCTIMRNMVQCRIIGR